MPYDPELISRLRMIGVAPSAAQMGEPDYIEDLRRYIQENAPRMEQYRPGLGRKILASALGGVAGLAGPKAGAAVHESIAQGPYRRAQEEYESGLEPRLQVAKIGAEQARMKREEAVAGARMGSYAATEALRRKQMNAPERPVSLAPGARLVSPTTGEEVAAGAPIPQRPTVLPRGAKLISPEGEVTASGESIPSPYGEEAEGFFRRTRGAEGAAGRTLQETLTNAQIKSREAIAGRREAGATGRQSARDRAAMERAKLRGPSASSQLQAERIAQRQVLNEHPEFQKLFIEDLAARAVYVPKPEVIGSKEHRDYLTLLEAKRRKVLASQQSQAPSEYDVEEVEPEEEEE